MSQTPTNSGMATQDGEVGLVERTFLTTGIDGSTTLHQRYPDPMLRALELHDDILYAAIQQCSGDPVRHNGDGILARFEHPLDAVHAAVAALTRLLQTDWGPIGQLPIRIGIHTGLSRPRGDDFFGPAMPIVKRLEEAASASQILLSDAALALIGDAPADTSVEFRDLGEHHFKGVRPLRAYQVVAPGLPEQFGPLGGKREPVGGNLPANLSSFLGRQTELNTLRELMQTSRILTLVGPGGIGKTRLAIELARERASRFQDGAWLVSLSAQAPGDGIWPALAEALSLPPLQSVQPREQVIDRLRGARAIVLLDNCEHLIEQVTAVVGELAQGCADVTLLNTSRRLLGLEGETVFEVPTLAPVDDTDLDGNVSMTLFIERAQKVNRRFQPDATAIETIGKICVALEHLPLSIEIAASQLRRLSLGELYQRCSNPLDLTPAGSTRRAPHRQQTLRETLEWSYNLLDAPSRTVLTQLAVFSGSIQEELGISLCADSNADPIQVRESIDELVDSSLLSIDNDNRRRLRMLDSVQAFGREKLGASLAQYEKRYCRVFAEQCALLGQQFRSPDEGRAVTVLYEELPNLRAAFERALEHDPELACDLARPLFLFNYFHRGAGSGNWGRRIIERANVSADQPLPDYAASPILLTSAATHALYISADQTLASQYVQRALQLERDGATSTNGWSGSVAGQIAMWAGQPRDSIRHHNQAIEKARITGNHSCEILSMSLISAMQFRVGDVQGALATNAELAQRESEVNQPSLIGYIHYSRGYLAHLQGQSTEAIREYEIALEYAHLGHNHQGVERLKRHIAEIRASQAEPAETIRIQIEALAEFPAHGDTLHAWWLIGCLLNPMAALGHHIEVATLAGALQHSLLRLNRSARQAVNNSRQQLAAERFDDHFQIGTDMTLPAVREFLFHFHNGNT